MSTWIFMGAYILYLVAFYMDWWPRLKRESVSYSYYAMAVMAWIMFMVGNFGAKWD